jgi:hypothetical protein
MNGDIILSGTWEAIGGNGEDGDGGGNGYLGFETEAMGKMAVNATMTVKGGYGKGVGASGGSPLGIQFYSYNYSGVDVTTPGKIRVSGSFDLRGGDGDMNGGDAGYLELYSYGANSEFKGVDAEVVGFPVLYMNGGNGAENGGPGSDWAVELYTFAPQYPHVYDGINGNTTLPAGGISNEAKIFAKGGKATGASGTGGVGGYVEMITNITWWGGSVADATTVVNNSGSIDLSGGTGDTGGRTYGPYYGGGYSLYFEAEHVTNTGKLTVNGGAGTTTGGDGGDISIYSNGGTPSTVNLSNMSVDGGTGGAADGSMDGADGIIDIDGGGGPE